MIWPESTSYMHRRSRPTAAGQTLVLPWV